MANKIQIIVEGVDKASSVIGDVGKAITGIGLAAGAAAVAGVAALGAGLVTLAKDAEPLLGVQSAFNSLTADIEGGSATMLASLQEASGGFITNADLMKSFNKAAGLVSLDFAERLPDAMGYLSKVAAATGQDMGYMMDSLVTGVGRLSPMILDNLQIQVSLEEATARAAEMFGVEADALTKTQQQAGMMDIAMEKLAANTATMADPQGVFAQAAIRAKNFRDELGLKLLPIITPIINKFMDLGTTLTDWLMPVLIDFANFISVGISEGDWLNDWLTHLPGPIQDAVKWIQGTLIPGIMTVVAYVRDVLVPYFLDVLIPMLRDMVTSAIQTLSDFWTGTLLPAIQAVWLWISTVLIPYITDVLVPWLQTNIPLAIQTLSDFWTDTLLPAMTEVWDWIQTTLIPALGGLAYWLSVTVPTAVVTAKIIFTDILFPALEGIYLFIKDNLSLILIALAGILTYKVGLAIVALVTNPIAWLVAAIILLGLLWKEHGEGVQTTLDQLHVVIWYYLDKWSNGIRDFIIKGIDGWAYSIKSLQQIWAIAMVAMGKVFDVLFQPLVWALGAISAKIIAVMDAIRRLADALRNIHLPDWMTPGSPTPWEMGLRGVVSAMRELNTMALPELQANLGGGSGRAAGGLMSTSVVNNYNLSLVAGNSSGISQDFGTMRALAGGI